MYTTAQFDAASANGARFFDGELNPVVPVVGEWFAEFEPFEHESFWDADLVQVVEVEGRVLVLPEGDDECRPPRGIALIRQGF